MRFHSIVSSTAILVMALPCLALSGGTDSHIELGGGGEPTLSMLDIQPNNVLDMSDVAFLLSDWGLSGSPADFNQDGVVDGADLGVLLSNFGAIINVAEPITEEDPGDVGPPVDCIGCNNNEA